MAPLTRIAVVLLALLPLALHPANAAAECNTAILVPAMSDCCCGPVLTPEEGCECSVEQDESGPASPATPVPAPLRTALNCQVQSVVATLAPDGCPSDARAATIGTRAYGEPPPRIAHGVFTL